MNTDLIKSATGTMVAEIVTLPICTIKSNYQNTHSTSMISTIKSIYERNGIKSFYSASIPAITGQVISTSSKYALYKQFEYYFGNDIYLKPLYGIVSGVCVSLITHPIDSIKVNMQMDNKDIGQKSLRFFYNGYSKSLSKAAISGPLFFPMSDYFSTKLNSRFYGSLTAATLATIIMHPIDYLKTIQMYDKTNKPKLTLYSLFTKGLHLNLMRIVPHFVIINVVMDQLNSILQETKTN